MKLMNRKSGEKSVADFLIFNSIFFFVAVLVIIAEIRRPQFLLAIPMNLLNRTAAYVFMALGMGFVMQLGGVDLSAGRMMGFLSLVTAEFLNNPNSGSAFSPLPIPVVLIMVLVGGAMIGCFNGFIVGKFKVHPYIVTLSVQLMLYGSMLVFLGLGTNHGQSISNLSYKFKDLITGFHVTDFVNAPFDIANYVWYSIITVIIVWLIWKYTPFGKNLRLFGENHEAAKNLNISPFWLTIGAFSIAGALFGLSGFIEPARVGGPGANAGSGAELDAIIACLIGGVSLKGGASKVGRIVLGVMVFQLIMICLQWLSVSANYVYIIKGILFLWAAAIDARKYYRGRGVSGWKWR